MKKHAWQVIVTDDDGGEHRFEITLADDVQAGLFSLSQCAIEEARNEAAERQIRVASIDIDWQEMFMMEAADLENAEDCIFDLQSNVWREDARGWVYGDEDEMRGILRQYKYE